MLLLNPVRVQTFEAKLLPGSRDLPESTESPTNVTRPTGSAVCARGKARLQHALCPVEERGQEQGRAEDTAVELWDQLCAVASAGTASVNPRKHRLFLCCVPGIRSWTAALQ
uniref:Uncharacterized protein n=1 Tax=Knipowitschia caucasica TaxID=637954 RepID=A0AAV2KMY4_KNICA